jgi:ubiquinone/menaquinone biosynthesis C-methylase UbiE
MKKWNLKLEIVKKYDDSSITYDNQYLEDQIRKIRTIIMLLGLKNSSLVLDVGCGTGILFAMIERETQSIVGIDTSLGMLKIAKHKSRDFPSVSIIRADADFPPFREEIFDAVFLVTLLQNMANPLLTLQKIYAVGKKTAKYAITGISKIFSKRRFTELLHNADFEISILRIDNNIKEIISICKKR